MITKPINKLNQMEPRSGGKLLLELLESEGVEYVFGHPGIASGVPNLIEIPVTT